MSGVTLLLSFIGYVFVLCAYAFLSVRCIFAIGDSNYKLAAAYGIPALVVACLLAKFVGF